MALYIFFPIIMLLIHLKICQRCWSYLTSWTARNRSWLTFNDRQLIKWKFLGISQFMMIPENCTAAILWKSNQLEPFTSAVSWILRALVNTLAQHAPWIAFVSLSHLIPGDFAFVGLQIQATTRSRKLAVCRLITTVATEQKATFK